MWYYILLLHTPCIFVSHFFLFICFFYFLKYQVCSILWGFPLCNWHVHIPRSKLFSFLIYFIFFCFFILSRITDKFSCSSELWLNQYLVLYSSVIIEFLWIRLVICQDAFVLFIFVSLLGSAYMSAWRKIIHFEGDTFCHAAPLYTSKRLLVTAADKSAWIF